MNDDPAAGGTPPGAQEPTGYLAASQNVIQYYKTRRDEGDFASALRLLQGEGTTSAFLRFGVPRAYHSEAEIDEWFAYAEKILNVLWKLDIDLGQAFDALVLPITFEFPYAGRDAKALLSSFGNLFLKRIIEPLFPDLCQPIPQRTSGKLRVGYVSTAMCDHHGSNWALGWLRGHTDDFETYAIHMGKKVDEVTDVWKEEADHYYQLTGPQPEAARFIKSLEVDALIYTDIGSDGRTTQTASMRLAPVQCTAWGHAITSGLPNVDYYLSSELMEPEDGDDHYTEKLVRLPNSGLVFNEFEIPAPGTIRQELSLPRGFLPLMNQNLMKCVPKWDHLFREVNRATGKPIVFIALRRYETQLTAERLHRAGVNAIWIPRLPHEMFMRLLQACDLILDTVEWSGGNTTVQALAVGTPMVTLPGKFMRGRHSLAFHKIAGADPLIATDPQDYVRIAADRDLQRESMKNVDASRLFNDPAPCIALNEFLWKACRT